MNGKHQFRDIFNLPFLNNFSNYSSKRYKLVLAEVFIAP